jgi:hypothetical protein
MDAEQLARGLWWRVSRREQDMQSSAWVALLRHIPAEQHDQYMLITVGGAEIAIMGLLRIEEEFVALKGRLSGSQEAGRVFFVPYRQIDYLGTQHAIKDEEFTQVFGSLVVPEGQLAEEEEEGGGDQEAALAPSAGSTRQVATPRPVIRSEVLERYRSRPASSAVLPGNRPNTNGSS